MLRKYCRAYHLKDMRAFRNWTEKRKEDEAELSDDDVVYLWDDFTVVRSPVIPDKGLIFDDITAEWQNFCKEMLHFEIPEDLRSAYTSTEEQDKTSEQISDAQSKASV